MCHGMISTLRGDGQRCMCLLKAWRSSGLEKSGVQEGHRFTLHGLDVYGPRAGTDRAWRQTDHWRSIRCTSFVAALLQPAVFQVRTGALRDNHYSKSCGHGRRRLTSLGAHLGTWCPTTSARTRRAASGPATAAPAAPAARASTMRAGNCSTCVCIARVRRV